jgi:hypothetical protein
VNFGAKVEKKFVENQTMMYPIRLGLLTPALISSLKETTPGLTEFLKL